MKKITKAFLLMALPVATMAQITITSSDLPVLGTSYGSVTDTSLNHTVTAAGASQTWNYGTGFFVIAKQDTSYIKLVTVASLPAAYQTGWNASDLAAYNKMDSTAEYYFNTGSGFYIDGIYDAKKSAGTGGLELYYRPSGDLFIPVPFTYNSSPVSNTYRYSISGVGYKLTSTTVQKFTGDAWGTLTTPAGSMGSCLRVKQVAITTDSTFLGSSFYPPATVDTVTTYSWYNNTVKGPVMTVTQNTKNKGSASYEDPTISGVSSITLPQANVKVYPNPAGKYGVTFSLENAQTAETLFVYNANGQLLNKLNIAGANTVNLQTEDMEGGGYFYSIMNRQGEPLKKGSFIVQK